MEKINFQDLPNTDTPINSTNLNLLQTNAENSINDVANNLSNYRVKFKIINNVSLSQGTNSIPKPDGVITDKIISVVIYRGGNSTRAYFAGYNVSNIQMWSEIAYSGCRLTVFYVDDI